MSPLGWSCGATGSGGGWNALALGVLAGLALLVLRRRPRA
ncbi:LPXTG cell wall anchor domain-containing protein [Archangium gephyra]|nr:LPXTG cell wall anchor domain-containing protein [Archangium gephyra]